MFLRNSLASALLATLAVILIVTPALAFPPLPSSFYGKVKVNGANVPDGTLVVALVNGQKYVETLTLTYEGDSVFSLNVPGDDATTAGIEGGKEGDTIRFTVGGVSAEPPAEWHSGTNVNLDLSATSEVPIEKPVTPPAPVPTQTAITFSTTIPASTATSQHSLAASATRQPEELPAVPLPSVIYTSAPTMQVVQTATMPAPSRAGAVSTPTEIVPTNVSPATAEEQNPSGDLPVAAIAIPLVFTIAALTWFAARKTFAKK